MINRQFEDWRSQFVTSNSQLSTRGIMSKNKKISVEGKEITIIKKLTVGSGGDVVVLDVYELNKDRLKLGLTILTGTGFGKILLLFKRK